MRSYLIPVMVFCFWIDGLLLMGASRLEGAEIDIVRYALAAAFGAVYGGACLLPGYHLLGNLWVRLACLGIMGGVAFGIDWSGLRRSVLFGVLNLATGGLAGGFGGGWMRLLMAAVVVCVLCYFTLGKTGGKCLVPVVLNYRGRQARVTALRDTGNRLCDPVTGESVLVVGASVAQGLLRLSKGQLQEPVKTLTEAPVPGLRLIPYRTVGQDGGLLLALRMEHVQIGKRHKSTLVAFAPEGLGEDCGFQALTGGIA